MTIDELLQRWTEGSLNTDQLHLLNEKLDERENQQTLLENWLIESSLPERLSALSVDGVSGSLAQRSGERHLTNWLSPRPVTAAFAGILFGVFSAALVFGYSTPRIVQQVIELTNPSFEQPIKPLADGIPLHFGVWSGDYSEIVCAQQGIIPHEGKFMFRFLRSDSKDGFPSRASHGNIYQFIDVRPWREAIDSGTAAVDWSAWFNCIREQSSAPCQFEASMWAFAGDLSFVRKNWLEALHRELGYSTWRVVADDNPATWQRVTGSLIVPPETNFLVVELKAIAGNEGPAGGVVTFAGHYADDVQMFLRTRARDQVQKSPSARP